MTRSLRSALLGISLLALGIGSVHAQSWSGSFGGRGYTVFTAPGISWGQAAANSAGLGAGWHLATITSAAEQNFVAGLISANTSGEFWLGGFQSPANSAPGANWHWVTGEAWNYTSWSPGEPNNYYGAGTENQLAIWSAQGLHWNDEGNLGNITGYVAEYGLAPAVPEPETYAMMLAGLALLGFTTRARRKREVAKA